MVIFQILRIVCFFQMKYRSLPKPPDEECINPFLYKSKEERDRIISETPVLLGERVARDVDPEKARKAQIRTYNK